MQTLSVREIRAALPELERMLREQGEVGYQTRPADRPCAADTRRKDAIARRSPCDHAAPQRR